MLISHSLDLEQDDDSFRILKKNLYVRPNSQKWHYLEFTLFFYVIEYRTNKSCTGITVVLITFVMTFRASNQNETESFKSRESEGLPLHASP